MPNELAVLNKQISEELNNFQKDFDKTDNKAAARRARKSTLALEKMFKEFRKLSIK